MQGRRRFVRVKVRREAVWELLDQLGISQNELARRCGITSGHLSLLINGRRCPSPMLRRRLMQELGVDDFDTLFIVEWMDGQEPDRGAAPVVAPTPPDRAAPGCGRFSMTE